MKKRNIRRYESGIIDCVLEVSTVKGVYVVGVGEGSDLAWLWYNWNTMWEEDPPEGLYRIKGKLWAEHDHAGWYGGFEAKDISLIMMY